MVTGIYLIVTLGGADKTSNRPANNLDNTMTNDDCPALDPVISDHLRLLQADIHAASVLGNPALAARLTMRYLDAVSGPDTEPSSESAPRTP